MQIQYFQKIPFMLIDSYVYFKASMFTAKFTGFANLCTVQSSFNDYSTTNFSVYIIYSMLIYMHLDTFS